eukprot:scaffold18962_cov140-Skeletonema_marinoi.AAC.11
MITRGLRTVVYLLESIGTSRISPTCIESKVEQGVDGSGGTLIKPSARLLFRYITATSSSRIVATLPIRKGLSSKKVESSSDTLLNIVSCLPHCIFLKSWVL